LSNDEFIGRCDENHGVIWKDGITRDITPASPEADGLRGSVPIQPDHRPPEGRCRPGSQEHEIRVGRSLKNKKSVRLESDGIDNRVIHSEDSGGIWLGKNGRNDHGASRSITPAE
jgi:hypothetical protein